MKDTKDLIEKANSPEAFREDAHKLVDFIADHLANSQSEKTIKTINWVSPEEQLRFWQDDFKSTEPIELSDFWTKVFSHSVNFHSKKYMGHQVATPLTLTTLTSAVMGYMNNSTTLYELAMAGNAMEKIVIGHLAAKFGYDDKATGFVTSGDSLGNLTALLTARQCSGVDSKDYHKLAIMVSEEAHYSIERAANVLGIPNENIIKVSADDKFRMRTELLESEYRQATDDGKVVFCIVGCACTTSVGAYDDLAAIAAFARKHELWFHVDGAHGGAVVFSDKYKHLLKGIEQSDSLILDFHKMMLVPALSTAIIFSSRNKTENILSPKTATYLWQDQQAKEWYNSARHTLECTKPISILHTYAIMRIYGDEIYQNHINKLYDLSKKFAQMITEQERMELAVEPSSNIVCFRYLTGKNNEDEVNKNILDELLKDGLFYVVGTTIRGKFYLRVSLMNSQTDIQDLRELVKEILKIAERE